MFGQIMLIQNPNISSVTSPYPHDLFNLCVLFKLWFSHSYNQVKSIKVFPRTTLDKHPPELASQSFPRWRSLGLPGPAWGWFQVSYDLI